MFQNYKDIADVVSLLVYCPAERTYLLTKEISGEFWIPSCKSEKNCWKATAQKINFELFGVDASVCTPLRVHKLWLPNHTLPCVYHAVYKVTIKGEVKKKTKTKGIRNRLQWFTAVELERQRAHNALRSPELIIFIQMATGDSSKDSESMDMESGMLIEICADNVLVGAEAAGGAVALTSPHAQLLHAASYTADDQVRLFEEFILQVFPALYMSQYVFTQLMVDLGWQRPQCGSLFRAADVTGRGGLSFMELLLWSAALEPATQHSGLAADIRCRYIFRYFDGNRDMKLEYTELKELVAAARAARSLPVDALSVARDTDLCLRQLGVSPGSSLPLAEFLRGVGAQRLRGTSALLRAPRSLQLYLRDLQGARQKGKGMSIQVTSKQASTAADTVSSEVQEVQGSPSIVTLGGSKKPHKFPDYSVASYTVRLHKRLPNEMMELKTLDEEAVSQSTVRLVDAMSRSAELLGPSAAPVDALAAVHYFATNVEKPSRSASSNPAWTKAAWSWGSAGEEAALGALLLRLAAGVRALCAAEPRLLRLRSPVYAIGDLHGNLSALLSLEQALWPGGTALTPATLLFLGDYVDRGPYGTELLTYLFAIKLQRPHAVLLIRGNHETRDIQKMFTFYSECVTKYGEVDGLKIWNAVNLVFDVLPLAAVVDDKVFCCHGGIPPPWVCPLITAIDKVPVPLPRPAEQSSIAWELLWNDPIKPHKMTTTLALELAANEGFAANVRRGTGHVFEQAALDRFLAANRLSHVVRAHELQRSGFMCQLKGRLISVFSSSNYCGGTNESGVALLEGAKLRLLRIGLDS